MSTPKKIDLQNTFSPDFSKSGGLVPVIVQDADSKEVLMLAYMNQEAWNKTLADGKACYYSRSKGKLWLKGETSGHFQNVKDILFDCDNDTILLLVEQKGAACHTGHYSCFYRKYSATTGKIEHAGTKKIANPEDIYKR